MKIRLQVQSIKSFQIALSIFALFATILALIALFTPAWRHVNAEGGQIDIGRQESIQYSFELNIGLFAFLCGQQNVKMKGENSTSTRPPNVCQDWADKRLPFETTVALLLIFGILFSLAAFFWDLLLLLGKFPDWNKSRWLLPPLASINTCLLAIAFITYWARGCAENDGKLPGWKNPTCTFGFSFFLAAIALFSSLLASFLSAIVVVLNRRLLRGSNYWS